ncbi:hypothetical protein LCGC14_2555430 [marine sediment metagenome]|uniref:Uncharacterized protein n=1 Tax=marine sediment metagenome TaxID=412755 RepID=A0A0F9B9J3_9ZZZZ
MSTQAVIEMSTIVSFGVLVSAANREGVEGEPQATLGGRSGSPRTGQWCRHCGSVANPSSDTCVPCWSDSMGQAMEVGVTGQMTKEFKEQFITLAKTTTVVAVALDPVLLPQQ